MSRRDLLVLASAAMRPFRAAAQPVPVIGFLNSQSPGEWGYLVAAFRRGLEETGFVEGRNVAIEFRWAQGELDRLPALASELAARRVAVIVATGGLFPARAAKAAAPTIPIVFTTGGDPVQLGLVASLNRPGGNVTGVNLYTSELMPKRLELIRDLVPSATSIAFLSNPANAVNAELQVTALREAVETHALALRVLEAGTDDEIERAFRSLAERRPDVLLVGADPFFNARQAQLVALAARHAIPAIYEWPEFVAAGGLMSYGPSVVDAYRQVGVYTGRILNGTKPADLPVQRPMTFELVINARVAKTLGLTIPPALLDRADKVIE